MLAGPTLRSRDAAIVFLLYAIGLRTGEVVTLDLADVDERGQAVTVRRRARTPEIASLPDTAWLAMATWLRHRSHRPGPLILPVDAYDSVDHSRRLDTRQLRRLVTSWSQRAGIPANPRQLRLSGIISAAGTPHPARSVLSFTRLASLPGPIIGGPLADGVAVATSLADGISGA